MKRVEYSRQNWKSRSNYDDILHEQIRVVYGMVHFVAQKGFARILYNLSNQNRCIGVCIASVRRFISSEHHFSQYADLVARFFFFLFIITFGIVESTHAKQ